MNNCDIIHVCIPSHWLPKLSTHSSLIILHDSTMKPLEEIGIKLKSIPVHLLMNEENTAIVDTDSLFKSEVEHHLKSLGFLIHFMTRQEHEMLMQKSQIPLFKLLHLIPELQQWNEQGLLTPSSKDLLEVLLKRDLAWSPSTKKSLGRHL